ncbi:MAG TPA: oligosaccharide flippase family protein [Euzebyales bacterium]|nr:oligosaccharide flippase family protein [Euzebyales bacterium]
MTSDVGHDPLDVLIVAQPAGYGVAVCVRQQAEAAVAAGHRVVVACPDAGHGPLSTWILDAGASHVVSNLRRRPALDDLRGVLVLRRLARGRDVMHLHSSKAGAVGRIAVATLRRRDRPAVVFTPHSWSWQSGGRLTAPYRWIERVLARCSDVIVAVSEHEAAEGRAVLGSAVDRLIVIPNGVDRDRFSPDGPRAERHEDVPLIACVARLSRQKGQDLAIRALAQLRNRHARLRLVGGGRQAGEKERLLRLAESLGVGDWIEWYGEVTDTAAQFRAADVVIAPSRWEGMSLVLLEAMACGAPIVATDVFGSDAIDGAGVVVPRDDTAALGHAIDEVLDNEPRRRRLGRAARQRSASYDLVRTLDRNLELWRALARERRDTRRGDEVRLGGGLRSAAARGVYWTALDNWGYQLATLVVFSVLARLVAPKAFGLIALATVFTSLLKIAADQGLADAIIQRADIEDEHINGAFWASVALGVVLTGLLAASSPLIATAFDNAALSPILAALSLTLTVSGLSTVQRAILTREFAFATLTLRSLVSVVVGGIAGIIAAVLGAGVWSLVVQTLTVEVVAVITLWVASDWRPRLGFSWGHVKQLLPFGANIVGFRALRLANTQVDNLMIGLFIGSTALGFYVVAYRVLRLVINICTSVIGSVAFPTFSRVQRDSERVQRLYYRTMRLAALVTFPAFLGVIILAPEVTLLMFGQGWGPSIPVMRVLGVAGLVTSIGFLNPTVIKALGKPSWRVAIMGGAALAQVVGFAIAVQWGVLAVATALAVVTLAVTPVWFYAVHKLVGLRLDLLARQLMTPAIASVLMVAAVLGVKSVVDELALIWQVVLLVATGVTTYALSLWLVDRPLAAEAFDLGREAIPGVGGRNAQAGRRPEAA